jgi:predicted TIM-barrel fold metal-dependent hydrolase
MASLLELVSTKQILFGTDFPSGGQAQQTARPLNELRMFDASALRDIDRENALALIPRLKALVA